MTTLRLGPLPITLNVSDQGSELNKTREGHLRPDGQSHNGIASNAHVIFLPNHPLQFAILEIEALLRGTQ
jgi:hypothetical protein